MTKAPLIFLIAISVTGCSVKAPKTSIYHKAECFLLEHNVNSFFNDRFRQIEKVDWRTVLTECRERLEAKRQAPASLRQAEDELSACLFKHGWMLTQDLGVNNEVCKVHNKNQNAAYGSSDAFSTRPFAGRYIY